MLPGKSANSIRSRVRAFNLKRINYRWTEQEYQVLAANYPHMGMQVAEILPHRTPDAVRNKVDILGLNKKTRDRWTKEEIDILMARYPHFKAKTTELLPRRTLSSIVSKFYRLKKKNLAG